MHKLKCNYGQLDMNVSNKLVYSPCYETVPIHHLFHTLILPKLHHFVAFVTIARRLGK